MKIAQGLDGLRHLPPDAVLTIGNFDGLHRGHRQLLGICRTLRDEGPHRSVVLVTFEPHPLVVLRPELAPPRLTPRPEKQALLEAEHVDCLVELPPEPAILNLTAEQFWAILRDQVRPSWIVEGRSFNFGKDRAGTLETLRQWAASSPVRIRAVDPCTVALLDLSIVHVSSSLIRFLLSCGRARDAAICLGRPYALEGDIVMGYHRGRSIGIPTANLNCPEQLIPADGVYAGRAAVQGDAFPAAVSIGTMPTFGENDRQVEIHLVGFEGDLYGQALRVEILDWLRDQRKYSSPEALAAQIGRDIQDVRRRQDLDAASPIASATRGCFP